MELQVNGSATVKVFWASSLIIESFGVSFGADFWGPYVALNNPLTPLLPRCKVVDKHDRVGTETQIKVSAELWAQWNHVLELICLPSEWTSLLQMYHYWSLAGHCRDLFKQVVRIIQQGSAIKMCRSSTLPGLFLSPNYCQHPVT